AAQFRHDLASSREIVLQPRRLSLPPRLVGAPGEPEPPDPAHKRSGYELGAVAVVALRRVAGALRRAIAARAALTPAGSGRRGGWWSPVRPGRRRRRGRGGFALGSREARPVRHPGPLRALPVAQPRDRGVRSPAPPEVASAREAGSAAGRGRRAPRCYHGA